MKFKEKLNQAAGFTLVELIVVIAILAILAGVAVPAYSGYITQANKQADISLVSDIKQALTLAYYSGDLTDSSYIVLSTDGVVNAAGIADGSPLDVAMKNAFGENWKTSLALKYGEWNKSPAFENLTAEAAKVIANSSFVTGSKPTELMESVTTLTNSIASSLDNKLNPVQSIKNNADPDSIAAVEAQLGVKIDDLTNTQLSNFALLVVANEMSQQKGDGTDTPSTLTTLVNGYAMYSGYIYSGLATDDEKAAYEKMNHNLANVPADLSEYNNSTTKYAQDQLAIFVDSLAESGKFATYAEGNLNNDMNSVMSMMGALDKGSSHLGLDDLGNSTLATDGVLGEYFDQYINAALVLAATGNVDVDPGQVAVCFGILDDFVIYSTID